MHSYFKDAESNSGLRLFCRALSLSRAEAEGASKSGMGDFWILLLLLCANYIFKKSILKTRFKCQLCTESYVVSPSNLANSSFFGKYVLVILMVF